VTLVLLLLLYLTGTGKNLYTDLYDEWAKGRRNAGLNILGGLGGAGQLIPGLISMTMDINGEDKESILDMLYSECQYTHLGGG
jgi:hypothetical protein